MATLMSYLYGSLMPALVAQRNNITMQNSSTQPNYPIPYYTYPSTYQPTSDVTVNERVSRAVATEEQEAINTTDAPPKNFETLPLDFIKHVVYKKQHHIHHHHHHNNSNNTVAVGKPVAIELPIICPKCATKMKLLISLATESKHEEEFCNCEENKPRYFCECTRVQPQICSICNKNKKYSQLSVYNWKQQATPSVIIVRKAPQSTMFSTTNSPNSYVWRGQSSQPIEYAPVEPSITKRYAVLPTNENTIYGGYEQQQQQQEQQQQLQEINSILNAVYEAAIEHEPTCYCWRCRFIRRF